MSVSYLLLTCAIHKNIEVANTVQKLSGVKEAVPVHGAYDCIVKVDKSVHSDVDQFVLSSIRPLDNIRSIITLHEAPPMIVRSK
ncbi:MAG: Lrp/AsnC ligand binding domain-containing protein [Nitrosopumilus sp.]|nr:Lrp/AsnC ligand binding domain-containing protein [Nitrosopumilus sp.]